MKVKVHDIRSIELRPENDAEAAILEVICRPNTTASVMRGTHSAGYGGEWRVMARLTFEEPPRTTLTIPIQDAKLRAALESCVAIERAVDAAVAKGGEAMAREVDRAMMGPPGDSHSGSPCYPQETEEDPADSINRTAQFRMALARLLCEYDVDFYSCDGPNAAEYHLSGGKTDGGKWEIDIDLSDLVD